MELQYSSHGAPIIVQVIIARFLKPSDFRSSDRHQERLRKEFKSIPDSTYLRARRGGKEDRASEALKLDLFGYRCPSASRSPPGPRYRLPRFAQRLGERREVYARYFSDHTSAAHIVLAYSLLRAMQEIKFELAGKPNDERTKDKSEILKYLRPDVVLRSC